MKHIIVVLVLMLLSFSFASAGEIFGTIKEAGKAVPKGTKIEIASTQKTYSAQTDVYGSYRLYVPEKGKCTLKVYVNKQSPSMDIFSYEKSTRCDISLESKNGQYTLKRK
jgi:hypothetical protein